MVKVRTTLSFLSHHVGLVLASQQCDKKTIGPATRYILFGGCPHSVAFISKIQRLNSHAEWLENCLTWPEVSKKVMPTTSPPVEASSEAPIFPVATVVLGTRARYPGRFFFASIQHGMSSPLHIHVKISMFVLNVCFPLAVAADVGRYPVRTGIFSPSKHNLSESFDK